MPASRSLIALLVGTVVFFALWMFALKPSSSTNGGGKGSSQGLGQYQSDINKAKQAVSTSNASNEASGNDGTASSSDGASQAPATASTSQKSHSSSSSKPSTTSSAKPASKTTAKPSVSTTASASPAVNLRTVEAAVNAHKVVALLFYNPAAADDQAVKHELASVPRYAGAVVKLAIPLNEAANFTAVTQQVPLNFSPTLVLISTTGEASEIVGYSDSFEINQRVLDAILGS